MAKISNTFLKSKMNKDLDARIIPSGEYRNAINVQVNKSEGDQVGSLENVLGNTKVADIGVHTGYAGTLYCIGQVVDDSNGIAYLFYTSGSLNINFYSPNNKNYIITCSIRGLQYGSLTMFLYSYFWFNWLRRNHPLDLDHHRLCHKRALGRK